MRATVRGNIQYTPAQLVYSKDIRICATTQKSCYTNQQYTRKQQMDSISSRHLHPTIMLHQGPYNVESYNEANGTLHIRHKNVPGTRIFMLNQSTFAMRPFFGEASRCCYCRAQYAGGGCLFFLVDPWMVLVTRVAVLHLVNRINSISTVLYLVNNLHQTSIS